MNTGFKSRKAYICALVTLIFTLALCSATQAAWKDTKAGRIYTKSGSPGYLTGWKNIDGARYYFDKKTGVMAVGWKDLKVSKKTYRYYFGNDGKLRTGFFEVEGYPYYASEKGRLQHGFLQINGKRYYADPSTGILAKKQWVDDQSGSYYFQADCTMAVNTTVQGNRIGADGRATLLANQSGFVRENRKVYYYDRNHRRVSGWLELNGNKYYLSPELKTGWFTVGGATYYADGDGAIVRNAWKGKKYLNAAGIMITGWATIGGTTYHFGSNGDYVTGAKKINGKRYRFSETGALKKNYWYTTEKGGRYYYGADGTRCTGLVHIGTKDYYFSANGRLQYKWITDKSGVRYYAHAKKGYLFQKRWFKKNGKKYYALADCRLAVGLTVIDGKTYIFSKKGALLTNRRRTVDGKTYYVGEDGAVILSQWKQIRGKYYYFGSDGVMVKNKVIDGYQIDENGVRQEKLKGGWVTKNGKKYYVTAGQYATGLTEIDGSTYYFDASGVMQTGIQEVNGKKRYFYPGGTMASGITLAVSNKQYVINSKGVVTSEKTIDVSGNSKGSQMAKFAIKYVGNPYVYGGTSLTNGADCSGFVMTVHSNFGIKLLRVANDQMNGPSSSYINMGYKAAVVVDTKNMLPGDLIFYGSGGYASHVAMYIGNGQIVHASNSQPYPAGGIKISNYDYQTPIKVVRYWS